MPNIVTVEPPEIIAMGGTGGTINITRVIAQTEAFTRMEEQEEGFSFQYIDCNKEHLLFALQSEESLAEEWNKPEDNVYNSL